MRAHNRGAGGHNSDRAVLRARGGVDDYKGAVASQHSRAAEQTDSE